MNDDQRADVRDAARYLQDVRPIDPEEIYEYVEGRPHPAAVSEVLRESAVDLGLLEREGGTFEPVADGPIVVESGPVHALPATHVRRLEDMLVETFGPGWPESEDGDRLRERIRVIKRRYHRGADVDYDRLTALGYAIYHLPATYAAARRELAALAADDLLPTHLRVLDVGAGVGSQALALLDLVPDDVLVEYHAIEPSAAANVLIPMLDGAGRNVHPTVHRTPIEDAPLEEVAGEGDIDLALFANVLNELAEPAAVLRRVLETAVAPDGTVLALAPADRNTAIGLRRIERRVADAGPATVYGPTLRLWPGRSPTGQCWSFDAAPDLAVPAVQRRLDESASDPEHEPGEFVNADVQYASGVLRRDDRRALDVAASRDRYAPMAGADAYVTERVDLLAVKLSHDLAGQGRPLYLIGDGSEAIDHFAVRADDASLTEPLAGADYGAILHFENVLALWNDDEGAYNVVVDDQALVEIVAERPR